MILLGAATLVLRVFEFAGLNCKWDFSSYASISWLLLGCSVCNCSPTGPTRLC